MKALQRAGFDMKMISIIGKDYQTEEHVIGFLNAGIFHSTNFWQPMGISE